MKRTAQWFMVFSLSLLLGLSILQDIKLRMDQEATSQILAK